jgi:hypothetical protein
MILMQSLMGWIVGKISSTITRYRGIKLSRKGPVSVWSTAACCRYLIPKNKHQQNYRANENRRKVCIMGWFCGWMKNKNYSFCKASIRMMKLLLLLLLLLLLTASVVRVPSYRSRCPGFDSRHYQILWEVVGLERGPLSLVSTIEKLLGRKNSGSGL